MRRPPPLPDAPSRAPDAASGEGMGDTSRPPIADDDGAAGHGPSGLRDVWRAARARRRALRSEVRRFTVRTRRRRRMWLVIGIAVAVLVVGTVGAAYSPLMSVDRLRVVGAEQLDAAEVEAALSDQLGTPMPLLDESAIKAALVAFPLVESYALEARPPHEVVVRIVERTPIGVVRSPAGYTVVDAAGVALATSPERPDEYALLEVSGGVDADAFAALGHVLRALPDDLRARVVSASASTPDDVTFVLGDTDTTVVWGGADETAMKALVLETTMASQPGWSSYDVSSPRAVVVR